MGKWDTEISNEMVRLVTVLQQPQIPDSFHFCVGAFIYCCRVVKRMKEQI